MLVVWITRLSIWGIMVGIAMMIQPFVFELFRYGFYLLLLSTVVYTVVGHITPKAAVTAQLQAGEIPASLGPIDTSESRP